MDYENETRSGACKTGDSGAAADKAALSAAPTAATSRRPERPERTQPLPASRSGAGGGIKWQPERSSAQRATNAARRTGRPVPRLSQISITGIPSTAPSAVFLAGSIYPKRNSRAAVAITTPPADGDRCYPSIRSGAVNPERQQLKRNGKPFLESNDLAPGCRSQLHRLRNRRHHRMRDVCATQRSS